jgi:photoactive yellow protein
MVMSKLNNSKPPQKFTDVPAPELLSFVEALEPNAIDDLPFGVIRLDGSGKVIFFSRTEAKQSGFGDRDAIGRKFFTELAPCMGNPDFMRRLEQAQSAGKLDITFEQVGDFDDAERELQVRMISASTGGLWVFLQRNRG